MTNEIKEIIKLRCDEEIEVKFFAKDDSLMGTYIDCDQLLDYITNLQEENSQLNKTINKIKKLRSANTHVENIYYAEGVLLNEPYCDIEDVDNEELLDILRGDE